MWINTIHTVSLSLSHNDDLHFIGHYMENNSTQTYFYLHCFLITFFLLNGIKWTEWVNLILCSRVRSATQRKKIHRNSIESQKERKIPFLLLCTHARQKIWPDLGIKYLCGCETVKCEYRICTDDMRGQR